MARKQRGRFQDAKPTADLFRTLKAMAADREVKDGSFRIAFRIAQATNERTGWAEISDAKLAAQTCASEEKVRRARRALEEIGWLRTHEGKRGRPTQYLILDTRRPEIEAQVEAANEARERAFAMAGIEKRTALAAESIPLRIDGETGEIIGLEEPSNPLKMDAPTPSDLRPLLPQSSTPGLPVKEEPQDVCAPEPAPAPFICTECGKPAVIRCRDTGEAYCARHTPSWLRAGIDYRRLSEGE